MDASTLDEIRQSLTDLVGAVEALDAGTHRHSIEQSLLDLAAAIENLKPADFSGLIEAVKAIQIHAPAQPVPQVNVSVPEGAIKVEVAPFRTLIIKANRAGPNMLADSWEIRQA